MKAVQEIEIYWTTKEVATRLRCTPDCVKKWLGAGKLVRTKAGGRTLISESDLKDFIHRSTKQK